MEEYVNKVICGDCLEFMKKLPDKCVDLVLTDPPYGIEYEGGFPNSDVFGAIKNDKVGDIDFELLFSEIRRVSKLSVIWGANNFYKSIPHKGSWLCWDKRCNEEADKLFGSKFELAWVDLENSGSGGIRIYRIQHAGAKNADGEGQKRFHPTQKPVELFRRVISEFCPEGGVVMDCFLGSGTTAVACKQLHRNFIGVEISEKYCEIARNRLSQDLLF